MEQYLFKLIFEYYVENKLNGWGNNADY